MRVEKAEIFDWLMDNYQKAEHMLAISNIKGVSYREYMDLVGVQMPEEFDLGLGEHFSNHDLRKELCGIYNCSGENVVTCSGGTEANLLAFMILLDKGDDFIVERPAYKPLLITPEMLGAKPIPWHRRFENGFDLDVVALGNIITEKTKLVIMTNLHNPSGRLASRDSIRAAAEVAADRSAYLLIDEIFLDGAFEDQISAFGIENIIITSSMTKVYGLGGARTAWVIAPEHIAEKCQIAKSHTTGASSGFGEWLNANALALAREKLVERFRSVARKNHSIVKEWVLANPDLLEWTEPDGGVICFPKYKGKITSVELCRRLLDEFSVLVIPGQHFDLDGHFRISYQMPENELRAALEALEKGLKAIM